MPSLRIAHVSDIHLAGYDEGATFDEDADLRRELEEDLERLVQSGGPMNLLILGGDVAGRGGREEFKKAARWIEELGAKIGVSDEHVYCVPGNHDVDQGVLRGDPVLRTLQETLLETAHDRFSSRLQPLLTTGTSRGLLLSHLEAYNEFAARYECDMQPESLRWSQVQELGPLKVKIVGVNSALLSGLKDAREPSGSLLRLTPQLANLGPCVDTLMVLVCHHPPEWLQDWARIKHLADRAQLQLFGHEHAAKVEELENGGLRVRAGAVHPDRVFEAWQPAYNVIELNVDQAAFPVSVSIWGRFMQPDGTFGPMHADVPVEEFTITGPSTITMIATAPDESAVPSPGPAPEPTPDLQRQVARRFAALSTEARLTAGDKLGLLTDADQQLEETLRGRQVFHRARATDRLRELEETIDA